jgi:hypothetical protein
MLRKKVYMPTREIVSGHPNRKYYCVKIDAWQTCTEKLSEKLKPRQVKGPVTIEEVLRKRIRAFDRILRLHQRSMRLAGGFIRLDKSIRYTVCRADQSSV